jgi:hypothetical protein
MNQEGIYPKLKQKNRETLADLPVLPTPPC